MQVDLKTIPFLESGVMLANFNISQSTGKAGWVNPCTGHVVALPEFQYLQQNFLLLLSWQFL